MKLQRINYHHNNNGTIIRTLCDGQLSECAICKINYRTYHPPFVSKFIEAAIRGNILTEAEMSNLGLLLRAGISKLQAALMPHNEEGLDTLLMFMAHRPNGSQDIKALLDSAKTSDTPLHDNESWWMNLFSTLNIKDIQVQRNIISKIIPTKPEQPASQGSKPTKQQSTKQGPPKSVLDQEIADAEEYKKQLLNLISKRKIDQNTAADNIAKLNAKLSQLIAKSQNEAIMRPMLQIFLEFPSIKSNIAIVLNESLRTLGRHYGFQPPVLTEAGMMDKLRTIVAHPTYAKHLVQSSLVANNNLKVAKLAVKLAIDHLKAEFNTKLEAAHLTPTDIQEALDTIQEAPKGSTEHNMAVSTLRLAEKLFNVRTTSQPSQQPSQQSQPEQQPGPPKAPNWFNKRKRVADPRLTTVDLPQYEPPDMTNIYA